MAPKRGQTTAAMKRPAAKKPRHTGDEGRQTVWTDDEFDLQSFLASLLSDAGLEQSQTDGGLRRQTPLMMAGGCDGTGLPHYVVSKMLKKGEVASVCASEMKQAPAMFMLRQTETFDVDHIFKDIKYSVRGSGPCWVHNRCCKLSDPSMQNLDLFVSGFSCKLNSRSNSERYTSDPIDLNKPECQTFVESLAFVKKHRPKFYVLENVLGALQPRIKGGRQTPLMWYEEALQSDLPDYTHATMVVDVSILSEMCSQMPRHSAAAFSWSDKGPVSKARSVMEDDTEKAVKAKRIPSDVKPPPVKRRASSGTEMGAWHRAQVDVYEMMLQSAGLGTSDPLADLSQTVDRGHYRSDGGLATLTTGCLWYNYQKKGFMDKADMVRGLGLNPAEVDYSRHTLSELREMLGNGMRAAMLVKVCLPILTYLKYFNFVPGHPR
ncbi:unnamed protein product [Symbiodinium natans]|uniref:Uncharacterized protein n=1 Tax=Symbiodinium natans TaxID=878477 RepID=A0A812R5M9_9DINO|nr:unnamed protein product [Symbiodinium natans]